MSTRREMLLADGYREYDIAIPLMVSEVSEPPAKEHASMVRFRIMARSPKEAITLMQQRLEPYLGDP